MGDHVPPSPGRPGRALSTLGGQAQPETEPEPEFESELEPEPAKRSWAGSWPDLFVRRIARLLVSLWLLITASFLLIHLIPGDPVRASMGPATPQETIDARRAALGLDDPLILQYFSYLRKTLTGDFGVSIASGLPVSDIVAVRLPATLELAFIGFAVTMAIAVPLGMVVAVMTRGGRRPAAQVAFASTTILLGSVPGFLLAVILVYFFAVQWHILPVAGHQTAASYVLPVTALALGTAASMARIVRAETMSVLGDGFIRTARSKRLS
ncbi:MAG: ABC transporter permease, partial [Bifidobacteriaceae bacterium]|nr:ABC transporter permease [Bifidobacteriaceae bacterium]